MKINCDKTKFISFNPTEKFDFILEYERSGKIIETEEESKILDLILRNDLWRSYTDSMIRKAYSRLWMIKRLKQAGASLEDMSDVYIKQIRSVLEFGVPVWNSALTKEEIHDIERVQSTFLHIVLGLKYSSYEHALGLANLETLQSRRQTICERFVLKAARHPKHQHWFQPSNPNAPNTRIQKLEYKQPLCRFLRFKKTPIPYLTSLLNKKL